MVTGAYKGLPQRLTMRYRGLQEVSSGYKGLSSGYQRLQRVTRG